MQTKSRFSYKHTLKRIPIHMHKHTVIKARKSCKDAADVGVDVAVAARERESARSCYSRDEQT